MSCKHVEAEVWYSSTGFYDGKCIYTLLATEKQYFVFWRRLSTIVLLVYFHVFCEMLSVFIVILVDFLLNPNMQNLASWLRRRIKNRTRYAVLWFTELLEKLKTWKKGMEAKRLKAQLTKTKLMISGLELNLLRDSGKYLCAVCRKEFGSNAIYCTGCAHWVHKRWSGIKGTSANRTDIQCKRCKGIARPIEGRPSTGIAVKESELEVVYEFYYLGDMIDAGGGCERASIARTKAAWGKFKQLLPLLTSRALPVNIRDKVCKSCVRSVMLHGSETWAPTKDTTARLVRNDRAMLRWMYNIKPNQEVSKQELMEKFNIAPLENILRANCLSWYGHVERSSGWINRCRSIKVPRTKGPGRPKKTWDETVRGERKAWQLMDADPQDRSSSKHRLCEAKNRLTPRVENET